MSTSRVWFARAVLAAACFLFATACAAKHGVRTVVPISSRPGFATEIKRIKVRVTDWWVIVERGPYAGGQPDLDPTLHPVGVVELVQALLVAKGYEVTFVWDDPWTYGRLRPCLMQKIILEPGTLKVLSSTPDPEAGPCTRLGLGAGTYQMSEYSGTLAPDEAFIELVTSSVRDEFTTTREVTTETQVGRVTDEGGNTIGNIYEQQQGTVTKTRVSEQATASIQVFVAGSRTPVLDAWVWDHQTQQVLGLVKQAIDRIPARTQ